MSVPPGTEADQSASGFREGLGRAARATFYLRVGFSVLFLVYAGFGPGLLFRVPATGAGLAYEPLARFYSFRPVVYALLFKRSISPGSRE